MKHFTIKMGNGKPIRFSIDENDPVRMDAVRLTVESYNQENPNDLAQVEVVDDAVEEEKKG